jgi:hypothetical protein
MDGPGTTRLKSFNGLSVPTFVMTLFVSRSITLITVVARNAVTTTNPICCFDVVSLRLGLWTFNDKGDYSFT